MMKTRHILLLFAVALIAACNAESQKAKGYTGDGTLHYLPGPLLGCSGWRVEFPDFNLETGISTSYRLTGLPPGDRYMIRLVVPDPCPLDEVQQGTFSFRLTQDGAIIKELPATRLSEMVDTQGGGIHAFWFYHKNKPDADVYEYSFSVTNENTQLAVDVSFENTSLQQPVIGHVVVERGGGK